MEGDAPAGGRWNFDRENRKPPRTGIAPPPPPVFEPDPITADVLRLVAERFGDRFGTPADFGFGVTPAQAREAAARFVDERLAGFGDYQDAMVAGEDLLWHSQLALYLNVGLLEPLALCRAAERAWQEGRAPLNAVEGFIRQIIGWREYVRGIYWLKMPDYAETNALGAARDLPWLYWGGETEMNCLKQCIGQTGRTAYAHHIQRLMVTGNFALLCDIAPKQICDWYLAVYIDAFDWVERPNTHGMVMYADGGVLGSKPYAAGGAYIDRMSDYCAGCAYDVKAKTGAGACPFNYLYWAFLMRHRDTLEGNRRLAMPYATLGRMEAGRKAAISRSANAFLDCLDATGTDPKAAGGS
jgi:deoxyribodipyrimidine photolyase-related protein